MPRERAGRRGRKAEAAEIENRGQLRVADDVDPSDAGNGVFEGEKGRRRKKPNAKETLEGKGRSISLRGKPDATAPPLNVQAVVVFPGEGPDPIPEQTPIPCPNSNKPSRSGSSGRSGDFSREGTLEGEGGAPVRRHPSLRACPPQPVNDGPLPFQSSGNTPVTKHPSLRQPLSDNASRGQSGGQVSATSIAEAARTPAERQPSLHKEPSVGRRPSLRKEPSGGQQPSFLLQETAGRQPSLHKQQSAGSQPSLRKQQSAGRQPSLRKQQSVGSQPSLLKQSSAGSQPALSKQSSIGRQSSLRQRGSLARLPSTSSQVPFWGPDPQTSTMTTPQVGPARRMNSARGPTPGEQETPLVSLPNATRQMSLRANSAGRRPTAQLVMPSAEAARNDPLTGLLSISEHSYVKEGEDGRKKGLFGLKRATEKVKPCVAVFEKVKCVKLVDGNNLLIDAVPPMLPFGIFELYEHYKRAVASNEYESIPARTAQLQAQGYYPMDHGVLVRRVRLKLRHIYTPPHFQPTAKAYLEQFVVGQHAECYVAGIDSHGRGLAEVVMCDRHVELAQCLLEVGLAKLKTDNPPAPLFTAQARAQVSRTGLWA